jgi:L-lysine 2,3-aminomutase
MEASKDIGLEVNTEKTKYMLLSHHQNQDMKIGNRCFENVAELRYLGTTITNQNLIQKELELR